MICVLKKKSIIGVLLSLLTSLTIGEVTLRLLHIPKLSVSGWKSKARELNDMGYRGQSINYSKETFVVVLLGDSQVESGSSDFENIPEQILERALRERLKNETKVFSIGTSGYGQDQQLLALKSYFNFYRADLVILWETRANDIWNNTFRNHWPKRSGAAKPTFLLKNDQLIGPTEEIGDEINFSNLNLLKLVRQFLNPPIDLERRWSRALPEPYKPMESYSGIWNETWQKLYDDKSLYLHGDDFLEEKSHLSIYFTPISDRMVYSRNLTLRLMQEIQRECRDHGARFISFEAIREVIAMPESAAVYKLNNLFFRASMLQAEQTIDHINQSQTHLKIPVRIDTWETKPGSDHLNTAANKQVLGELSDAIVHHFKL